MNDDKLKKSRQDNALHKKQLEIIELFGTVEYEVDYDYKEQRRFIRPARSVMLEEHIEAFLQ